MKNLGKVALCLPGGGAKGIIQASMYQAFKDLGLKYDVLIGTSSGAINACMIHQNAEDKLIQIWENIKNSKVFTLNLFKLFRSAIYDNSPLLKLLKDNISFDHLLSREEPLYINVTDMGMRSSLTLSIGDFEDAEEFYTFLRSSASPPVYFEPLLFRGTPVCDGGVVSNFNIRIARQEKCDKIIILCPSNKIKGVSGIKQVLDTTLYTASEQKLIQDWGDDIIFVKPMLEEQIGLLDFEYKSSVYSREQLMKIGYSSALNTLKRELCL